jgi:hypothetical protein
MNLNTHILLQGMDKRASMCVGLTCEDYSLNKHIGKEAKSYGYFSEEGRKLKNGENVEAYGSSYSSGDVVGCGFNTVTREIFFTKNGTYLGVAFWDVPDHKLCFSVSLRGVVGLTCVATFHGPFKFDLHALPDISPSMWSESLGDPALSDEQVIYPPTSVNSSRLQQQQQQQTWNQDSSSGRETRGLNAWPANDVAIWLESIGYGQYRKEFHNNNISGRHLNALSHQLLKNELKIESYGHRADILDRVNKLLITWKDKVGVDESSNSSLIDYSTDFATSGGSVASDFSDHYTTDPNGASINDAHPSMSDEPLQPFRPPLFHHSQAAHRFSDHENSEDENTRTTRPKNRNPANLTNSQANNNSNMVSTLNPNTTPNPAGITSLVSSLLNCNDKDSKWRRRTVPYQDAEVIFLK